MKASASDRLAELLARLEPRAVEPATWFGTMELRISCYLGDEPVPRDLVSSVRAVMLTDQGVAVLHNPHESHLLPGGRCEPGESVEETLRREVLEETGCEILDAQPIGFIHFRHLTPRPEGYPYPYPDFLQIVYAARGRRVVLEPKDPTGWEQGVEFVLRAEVERRRLNERDLLFLEAAFDALGLG